MPLSTFYRPTVPLEVNSDVDLGTLTLPERHNLTVEVTDQDGNPVSDASIFLSSSNPPPTAELAPGLSFSYYMSGTGTAVGADGTVSFNIEPDPNLGVVVNVSRPDGSNGYVRTTVDFQTDQTLQLGVVINPPNPTYSVSGRVVEADGSPVASGFAAIQPLGSASIDPLTGEFAIPGVPGGLTIDNLQLWVDREQGPMPLSTFYRPTVPLEVNSDVDLGTLTLPQRHNLTVEVTDQDGNPVSDASIFLSSSNPPPTAELAPGLSFSYYMSGTGTAVGADGTVSFNIEPDPNLGVVVNVSRPDGSNGYVRTTVDFQTDQTLQLGVVIRPPPNPTYSVSGRVVEADGSPVASGFAAIQPLGSASIDPLTGEFRDPGVPGGLTIDNLQLWVDRERGPSAVDVLSPHRSVGGQLRCRPWNPDPAPTTQPDSRGHRPGRKPGIGRIHLLVQLEPAADRRTRSRAELFLLHVRDRHRCWGRRHR